MHTCGRTCALGHQWGQKTACGRWFSAPLCESQASLWIVACCAFAAELFACTVRLNIVYSYCSLFGWYLNSEYTLLVTMANLITIKNAEILSTIHNIHRALGNPCSRDSQSLAYDLGNILSSLLQKIIVKNNEVCSVHNLNSSLIPCFGYFPFWLLWHKTHYNLDFFSKQYKTKKPKLKTVSI